MTSVPPPPEWSFMGINFAHFFAGLIGGGVRAGVHPESSLPKSIAAAFVGAIVAGYGTPIATDIAVSTFGGWGATTVNTAGVMGFILGLTGLSLCEGFIRLAIIWRNRPSLPGKK